MAVSTAARGAALVRKYFAGLTPTQKRVLRIIRSAVRAVVPRATEDIAYHIPTFRIDGKGFLAYAAWKQHVSMYPIGPAIRQRHAAALTGRKYAKGTIQFALDDPPSSALVKRLVRSRLAEFRRRGR